MKHSRHDPDTAKPEPVADATGSESFEAADGVDAPAPPTGTADTAGTGERSRGAAIESERAQEHDKYLRLAAEYDNFRKRAVRDKQRAEQEGMSLVVRGLLEALDDLGRFAHVDPATTDPTTLQQGVEMVEKKMLKSLAGHGLEIVNPVGHPFDPAVHEALSTVPAASPEEDHLIDQVYQVGYVFNGQLLRAARVVVKQWNG